MRASDWFCVFHKDRQPQKQQHHQKQRVQSEVTPDIRQEDHEKVMSKTGRLQRKEVVRNRDSAPP